MTQRTARVSPRALLAALPLLSAPILAACAVDAPPDDGKGGGTSSGGTTGGTAAGTGGKSGASGSSGTGGTSGKAGAGGAGGTTGGVSGAGGAISTGGGSGTGGLGSGGTSGTAGVGGAGGSGVGGSAAGVGGGGGKGGGGAGGSAAGFGGKGAGGAAGDSGAGGTAAGSGGSGGSAGSGDTGKSAGCGKTRTLMNGRKTIQSGGNREYILRVPDNYDSSKPYRLIFAFHWLNGNANQVAEGGNGGSTDDPYYGLWDLAENSTIFVAPEGLNAGWANSGGADVNLTDAILEQVSDDLCIDTTRIFATGFSYGAGMSYALACARADVFRGVALYAGAQLSGCSGGTTPIAYFHVHGVADSVLNISQGRQLRDKFVGVNGCTPQNPPEEARGSGRHSCTSYEGCSDGHPLRWCTHGGDHNPTEKDSGQSKSWIPGEAWEFISQF